MAMGLVGIAENRNVGEISGRPVRPNVAIDLAQIDLNLEPLELKPVDLNMLVEQVIEMHRNRAEPDGTKLITVHQPIT